MKTSVAHLEQFMEASETGNSKGKIILATVKGDVHDIGKNLVEIILANNGYEIIDLGIKVTSQQIIEAVEEHKPSMIGLSGLLVKSAQQMVLTAQDLKERQINTPIMVGGAALSRKFTDFKIAPEYEGTVLYAKDAMDGLALANTMHDHTRKLEFITALDEKRKKSLALAAQRPEKEKKVEKAAVTVNQAAVKIPEDTKRHVLVDYPLQNVMPYVNRQMLIGHHLGLKGKLDKLLEQKDEKALELTDLVDTLYTDLLKGDYSVNAVYQFFPAQSDGNKVIVYNPDNHGEILEEFDFPRQGSAPFLCLADFLKPVSSGEMDYVGFFVVTAGKGIRQRSDAWKENGEFLKSHAIQSIK